jgi:hypothetical protein
MPYKNRADHNRVVRARANRLAACGLCVTCTNPTNGFRLCNPCRVEDSARKREKRAAMGAP